MAQVVQESVECRASATALRAWDLTPPGLTLLAECVVAACDVMFQMRASSLAAHHLEASRPPPWTLPWGGVSTRDTRAYTYICIRGASSLASMESKKTVVADPGACVSSPNFLSLTAWRAPLWLSASWESPAIEPPNLKLKAAFPVRASNLGPTGLDSAEQLFERYQVGRRSLRHRPCRMGSPFRPRNWRMPCACLGLPVHHDEIPLSP